MIKKIFLFVLCIFLFAGCNLKKEELIVFDNSQPLALAPDVNWAVVNDPYATYRDEMSWNSSGKTHCRKGEILQILGKSIANGNEVWYRFENGWLPGTCLVVYDNRYKAEAYSKKIVK